MIPVLPMIAWKLLAVVAVAVLSFSAGIKVRGDHEAAKQLTLERGWHEAYKQGTELARRQAEAAGVALRGEQADRAELVARLRAENARGRGKVVLATCPPANAPTTESPTVLASEPDRVVLTPDFRLRYDTALALVVPAGDRARWVDAAGAATGSADLWTVLDAHTENASRWAQCREMMTAAQQWFKQMGWVQ
jgi:hypothetical protein